MAGSTGNNKSQSRPDWKARQARKRVVGIVKTFVAVIVLGVGVGLGIVYKDQLLALLQKKETATAQPAPPAKPPVVAENRVSVPPAITNVTAPAIPAPPTPTNTAAAEIIPTGEENAAVALITAGKSQMEQFNFDEARNLFNQASLKKCGTKLRAEAKLLSAKAENFKVATHHIPVAEYALAETSYVVHTTDGREFCALKLEESPEEIKFQSISKENPAAKGKMVFPVARGEIERLTPVSREERRKSFLALLGTLESSVAVHRSTDYYDLVYLSRRLNLGRECIAYLNRACDGGLEHAPDPYLGDSFRKEVVRRAIDRAAFMLAAGQSKTMVKIVLNDLKRDLPGFAYANDEVEAFNVKCLSAVRDGFHSTLQLTRAPAVAMAAPAQAVPHDAAEPTRKSEPAKAAAPAPSAKQLASEASGEDQVEVVINDSGVKGSGAMADVVEKANARYEEGMKWYRQFRQGSNGDNNKVLRNALVCLNDAIDLYGQALDKDPNNKAVSDRQTEANMVAYGCRKYQTL